ncbi:hypothetical protein [Streptomyces lavendulae]|uniref:hypothetical protein n=1 Tax=Streptomyces lavendulae TaxID=1914 RepID=UPI0024A16877|nr:hypothetical protein [Streptomyces lavendulae]GLX24173.1 hypothetical protein Slala01_78170 [Streptomyces lavendulae subsp. lavendulae]GLX31683.1 hypothetical protein Slala02_75020 [Streptomyces lavendulae subsp. lavendulae]
MSPIEAASNDLQALSFLWSIGEARSEELVEAACSALVAGLDGPTLRMLAGCTHAEAPYEVPELLPAALEELGLVFYPHNSEIGPEAAARALAHRFLAGGLTPQDLVFRMHLRFGHELPLAERLAELDDEYAIFEHGDKTLAQLDAEVTAEAQRLTAAPISMINFG